MTKSLTVKTILSQAKIYLALFGAPMATIEATRAVGVLMMALSVAITAFQKKMEEEGIEYKSTR